MKPSTALLDSLQEMCIGGFRKNCASFLNAAARGCKGVLKGILDIATPDPLSLRC